VTTQARKAELLALDSVDDEKVRSGMAFSICFPLAFEFVIPVSRGKRETCDKKSEHRVHRGDIAFFEFPVVAS